MNIDELIAKKNDLTGQDYFEYQALVSKQSQSSADEWLLLKAYGLTAHQANNELTFVDRVTLDKEVNKVPEGYEVAQLPLSGAAYPIFKSKLAKDPTGAIKWLSTQLFSVNGTPMKDLSWNDIPYGVANQFVTQASAFF